MYSRVSPIGCAYYTFLGLIVVFLWITGVWVQNWRVVSAGVWTTGTVVGIAHCQDSHGLAPTVNLEVQFADARGVHHISQTDCEYDRYRIGQTLDVKYLPSDPGHILIRDDIDSSEGSSLVVMLVLDTVSILVFGLWTAFSIRALRRDRAAKADVAAQHGTYLPPARKRYARRSQSRRFVSLSQHDAKDG